MRAFRFFHPIFCRFNKSLWQFLEFDICGGVVKKGSYVKFQLKVEVLIREETEQKVGLERAFIVIVLEKQAQRIKTEVKDGYLCTWLCCINLTVAVASSQGAPAIWKFSNCLPYWSSAC